MCVDRWITRKKRENEEIFHAFEEKRREKKIQANRNWNSRDRWRSCIWKILEMLACSFLLFLLIQMACWKFGCKNCSNRQQFTFFHTFFMLWCTNGWRERLFDTHAHTHTFYPHAKNYLFLLFCLGMDLYTHAHFF